MPPEASSSYSAEDPSRHVPSNRSTAEQFEDFHSANPHLYAALVRLARRYKQATGEQKQSVQRLVEIARWDEKIRTRGDGEFEINNNFRPFYSRLIMEQESDLRGIFDLRRSDEADAWIDNRMAGAAR